MKENNLEIRFSVEFNLCSEKKYKDFSEVFDFKLKDRFRLSRKRINTKRESFIEIFYFYLTFEKYKEFTTSLCHELLEAQSYFLEIGVSLQDDIQFGVYYRHNGFHTLCIDKEQLEMFFLVQPKTFDYIVDTYTAEDGKIGDSGWTEENKMYYQLIYDFNGQNSEKNDTIYYWKNKAAKNSGQKILHTLELEENEDIVCIWFEDNGMTDDFISKNISRKNVISIRQYWYGYYSGELSCDLLEICHDYGINFYLTIDCISSLEKDFIYTVP